MPVPLSLSMVAAGLIRAEPAESDQSPGPGTPESPTDPLAKRTRNGHAAS